MKDRPSPLLVSGGAGAELKDELVDFEVYAFLTTAPHATVAQVHPDRMPVIVAPEDYETWLHGSVEEAHALARPFPAYPMRVVKVGDERVDAPCPKGR